MDDVQLQRAISDHIARTVAINVVERGYVDPTGYAPIGDGLWRAGIDAMMYGHCRLILPASPAYRIDRRLDIPCGVIIDAVPMKSVINVDFDRQPGEPAIRITDAGYSIGNGGVYTGLTVHTNAGKHGGVSIQMDAYGISGAHYSVLRDTWVSTNVALLNGTLVYGSWDWALVLEGRHNNSAADGLRFVTVERLKAFFCVKGYVYEARCRACVLLHPGFYAPKGPEALAPQAEAGIVGVAQVADTYPDCLVLHRDS